MEPWIINAFNRIRSGEKIPGDKILGLIDLGLVFIERYTETVIFTIDGLNLLKEIDKEMVNTKILKKESPYPAG